MGFGRLVAVVAALVVMGACASAQRPRHEELHPWSSLGLSPVANDIEVSLYFDALEMRLERCPFYLARCSPLSRTESTVRLKVDEFRCSEVSEEVDRCTFHLTETMPGRDAVRSHCVGRFGPAGHSHEPFRWALRYGSGKNSSSPALICRNGRTERHAVW